MDGPGAESPAVCLRCGKCCLGTFSRHVAPEDGARWEREGRLDLVAAAREEDLDRDAFLGRPRLCRFLNPMGDDRTACSIYEARPQMCREFKPGRSRLCPAGKKP